MPKGRKNKSLSTEATTEEFLNDLLAGDSKKVRRLLKSGADVNQSLIAGNAPLHVTASRGHVDCTRLLIENKADVDKATTDGGATPLYIACQYGHVDCARALIESKADVDKAKTDDGRRRDSALHSVS